MNSKISALHFKADSKLEGFIQEKIDKLTTKHDIIIGSEVILKVENSEKDENKTVEMKLLIKGNDLFASKTCKSFEEATDMTITALMKQLSKKKEKVRGI